MIKQLILTLLIAMSQLSALFAQDKYAFSNKILNIEFLYNYHMPAGDIGKLYENFSSIGTGALLKTKKNWVYAAELSYLFGQNLKDQHLLDNMVNGGGYIASVGGSQANYSVNMRGFEGFLKAGRLFAFNKYNMNCGLILMGGAGFLEHYTNFQIQGANAVPQLDDNYKKGYDRLTYGIAFNEFAGYYFHSKNRLINFYLGVDFVQGINENKRGFNYDKMESDKGEKRDYITSFRVGWMIPIYLNTKEENEFNFR